MGFGEWLVLILCVVPYVGIWWTIKKIVEEMRENE